AFELTQAGQKALFVLFWAVQNKTNNDLVLLDQYTLNDFINENKGLSMSLPTFKRGLGELVKSQILAMNKRKGFYYINPNFVFNGDRVAFTTVLEMNKSSHKDK
nr:replication/maintenance protein RepL [Escherichia coli]